jgi:hypothetical protein
MEEKLSDFSDPEFPVPVSVDDAWQYMKTIGGYEK